MGWVLTPGLWVHYSIGFRLSILIPHPLLHVFPGSVRSGNSAQLGLPRQKATCPYICRWKLVPSFCSVCHVLPVPIFVFILRVSVAGLYCFFATSLSFRLLVFSLFNIPLAAGMYAFLLHWSGLSVSSSPPFLLSSLFFHKTGALYLGTCRGQCYVFYSFLGGVAGVLDLSWSLSGLSCPSSSWVGSAQPVALTPSAPDPPGAFPSSVATVMCFANLLNFSRRLARHLILSHRLSSLWFIRIRRHILEVSLHRVSSSPGPCPFFSSEFLAWKESGKIPLPHSFLVSSFEDFFFFFFFFLWMGTQNGHNVPFLESASLEKRKRSVIKQFYKISKKS